MILSEIIDDINCGKGEETDLYMVGLSLDHDTADILLHHRVSLSCTINLLIILNIACLCWLYRMYLSKFKQTQTRFLKISTKNLLQKLKHK